jgi:hypothetical protein
MRNESSRSISSSCTPLRSFCRNSARGTEGPSPHVLPVHDRQRFGIWRRHLNSFVRYMRLALDHGLIHFGIGVRWNLLQQRNLALTARRSADPPRPLYHLMSVLDHVPALHIRHLFELLAPRPKL